MHLNIRPNRAKRPVGVPPPSVQPPPQQMPTPAVPPSGKRPRSNLWLLGLIALFTIGSWWFWDHFIRTSAYAVVEVDQMQVSAPLSGVIQSMSIREDGDYEGGTVAFSILDRDSRNEQERLQLQLRLLESRLAERMMELKLRRDDRLYRREEVNAHNRAELAEARVEKAELTAKMAQLLVELEFKEWELARLKHLNAQNVAAPRELDRARTDFDAASSRYTELQEAERAARSRIDTLLAATERPIPRGPTVTVGVDPLRREIDLVRRRMEQLHEQLQESEVRLPSPGRVVRILRLPGEYVRVGEPVVIVSRPSTLRLVAYFEQSDSSQLHPNKAVHIVSSYAPKATGRITRVGPSLKLGPEAIARYHPEAVPLLPVEIEVDSVGLEHLVPGSVVRVYPDVSFSKISRAQAGG